jgi:hypothetical protein
MSKKHYQAIAAAIYAERQWIKSAHTPGNVSVNTLLGPCIAIASRIAGILAEDNPRFDRARFLEACETGTTKGMRAA